MGRPQTARYLQNRLAPLTAALAKESPAALKYALCLLGFMSPATRLPIVELADAAKAEVASAIAAIGDEDIACPVESRHGPRLHEDSLAQPRRSRMSCNGHAMERYAGTLRAWHLAILRYAVTRDNADRLAVFRIALEIDSLERRQDEPGGFRLLPPHQRGALHRDPAAGRTRVSDPAAIPGAD